MKTIKLYLLILIISLSGTTLLSSCQKEIEPFSEETIITNAGNFLNALCTGDYQTVIDLAYLPNNSFFIPADIEEYLEFSSFKDLFKKRDSIKNIEVSEDISTDENKKTVNCTLYDKNNKELFQYNVVFLLSENNQWRIDVSEFYITGWQLKTCGGNSVLYIEGQEVNNISYDSVLDSFGNELETYRTYTFGAIGKVSKTFSIVADTFVEEKIELTPGVDNEIILRAYVSSEDSMKLFEDIKTSWNGLYTLYSQGNDYSAAYEYISSDVDISVIEKIWQNFIVLSTNGTDFQITAVTLRDDSASFYYTDTLLVANFAYTINWSGGTMMDYSSLIMSYEDGKYKISIIPYEKLFYYVSTE